MVMICSECEEEGWDGRVPCPDCTEINGVPVGELVMGRTEAGDGEGYL